MFFREMMISSWWVMNTIADCYGISIDQLMLGIGEVWYFRGREGVFSQNNDLLMVLDEQQVLLCMNTSSLDCRVGHMKKKVCFVCVCLFLQARIMKI